MIQLGLKVIFVVQIELLYLTLVVERAWELESSPIPIPIPILTLDVPMRTQAKDKFRDMFLKLI